MYAMDLYIDVYAAYTYVYMCICKLHTCVKPVWFLKLFFD